jgi:hypothetical protein
MTDNEPPEGASPQEEPSAVARSDSAPTGAEPQTVMSGPSLAFSPVGRIPTSTIQTPGSAPANLPIGSGQTPVLQLGPPAGPVYIDIGDKAAQASIARDGMPIPVISIDQQQLQTVNLIPPVFTPRVVKQTVDPGTRVQQGTSVDLTLAAPNWLPINIVPGVYQGFVTPPSGTAYTLAQVYTQFIQNNAALQAVLTRNTTAPDPNSADSQTIIDALSSLGLQQGDVPSAFAGLQAAMTFGS